MADEQELIRKIGLLLKKAEGTDNENEAAAFYAKAQELMVLYAIEEQRVRAAQELAEGRRLEEPMVENFMFSSYAHHAAAKASLLGVVAKANSVHSILYSNRKDSNQRMFGDELNRGLRESQWTRLVGYKSDIEHVKLLFVSLLIQSQRFANEDWNGRYGRTAKHSSEGLGKFTWLSAHMDGFAERIGERFRELTQHIYEQVADGNALILDKDANILEWMYEHRLMSRPITHCWAVEPPDQAKANRHRAAYYCIKAKDHERCKVCGEELLTTEDVLTHALLHGVESEETAEWYLKYQPDYGYRKVIGSPHDYNYKPQYSSYSAVGRVTSREGRNAGRDAGNRADIGQPGVGAGQRSLTGGR